jgi:hypothetical protein
MKMKVKKKESVDDNTTKSVRLRRIRKAGSRTAETREKNSTITDGDRSVK